jgi:hypothetical protein
MLTIPSSYYVYEGLKNFKDITISRINFSFQELEPLDYLNDDNIDQEVEDMVQICRHYKRAGCEPNIFIINPILLFRLKNSQGNDFQNEREIKEFYYNFLQLKNIEDIDNLELILCTKIEDKITKKNALHITNFRENRKLGMGFILDEKPRWFERYYLTLFNKDDIVAVSDEIKIDLKVYEYMNKFYKGYNRI